jgi:hypothetical protein
MSDISADSGLVVPLFFISRMLTGERRATSERSTKHRRWIKDLKIGFSHSHHGQHIIETHSETHQQKCGLISHQPILTVQMFGTSRELVACRKR